MKRDLTLLIAHPDDEIIFMWPFLERVQKIICASSDANNPARAWCARRGECLAEVAKLLGCTLSLHHNDSEFYRAETRPEPRLKNIASALLSDLAGSDIVATHNAWGEDGHLDHLLCHHVANTHQARTGGELLVTNIAQEINWLPVSSFLQYELFERLYAFDAHLDADLYDRIKRIYEAKGCWTWSFEPQRKCRVYSL